MGQYHHVSRSLAEMFRIRRPAAKIQALACAMTATEGRERAGFDQLLQGSVLTH